jgi:prepilin-type N-terminal cleavage/methylation domain-containing protein
MKRKLNKGFTLAELLIVVAIIGVLVAISIPIFTSQLEKSRDAVTLSNVRAAYAEAQSAYLTGSGDGSNVEISNGGKTVTVKNVEAKGKSNGLDGVENLPIPKDGQDNIKSQMGNIGTGTGKFDIAFGYDDNGLTSVTATPVAKQ